MKTPQELKEDIIKIFPSFIDEFDDELEYKDEYYECNYGPALTLHRIWSDFAPVANKLLSQAKEKDLIKFVKLINFEVTAGLDRKNAVSTCFLEHASQVSARILIKPFLSKEAKKELR